MKKHRVILRGEINRERAHEVLDVLVFDTDHPMEMIVQEHKTKRSLDQNALMWKWISEIGDELGYDKHELDDLHEAMCREHGGVRTINLKNGKTHEIRNTRTSRMTVKEMTDYLNWMPRWAAQQGIVLSDTRRDG